MRKRPCSIPRCFSVRPAMAHCPVVLIWSCLSRRFGSRQARRDCTRKRVSMRRPEICGAQIAERQDTIYILGQKRKKKEKERNNIKKMKRARATNREGQKGRVMDATHPFTSKPSPLRLSPLGAGEVEVAILSDCDFSSSVMGSGCDVITAIRLRQGRRNLDGCDRLVCASRHPEKKKTEQSRACCTSLSLR